MTKPAGVGIGLLKCRPKSVKRCSSIGQMVLLGKPHFDHCARGYFWITARARTSSWGDNQLLTGKRKTLTEQCLNLRRMAEMDEMCINPRQLFVKGIEHALPCRNCWQCRANRVNDLVGRCIAESKHAQLAECVTLTYGSDKSPGIRRTTTPSAAVLTYADVQKWFKRLRFDGYRFRYVIAGEKGELKGRCHWHALMFWEHGSPLPQHPPYDGPEEGRWWHDPHWTKHPDSAGGHSHWKLFHEDSAKYVCKYVLKDLDAEKEAVESENIPAPQSIIRWSKKPLLGAPYFTALAGRYVEQGLVPTKPAYRFPEIIVKKTGLPREYWMNEATCDYFCAALVEQWQAKYGKHPLHTSHSDFLADYEDRKAQRLTTDAMERRRYSRAPKEQPMDLVTGEFYPFAFDELRNVYVALCDNGEEMFWSYDDWGNLGWQSAIKTRSEVAPSSNGYVRNRARGPTEGPAMSGSSERYRKASNGD